MTRGRGRTFDGTATSSRIRGGRGCGLGPETTPSETRTDHTGVRICARCCREGRRGLGAQVVRRRRQHAQFQSVVINRYKLPFSTTLLPAPVSVRNSVPADAQMLPAYSTRALLAQRPPNFALLRHASPDACLYASLTVSHARSNGRCTRVARAKASHHGRLLNTTRLKRARCSRSHQARHSRPPKELASHGSSTGRTRHSKTTTARSFLFACGGRSGLLLVLDFATALGDNRVRKPLPGAQRRQLVTRIQSARVQHGPFSGSRALCVVKVSCCSPATCEQPA